MVLGLIFLEFFLDAFSELHEKIEAGKADYEQQLLEEEKLNKQIQKNLY